MHLVHFSAFIRAFSDLIHAFSDLIDAFNVEMTEFLWITHPDYNFLAVITGKNDNDIQSACNILYSSGAWNSFSWFRAFESTEMKNIFEDSSKKMANYISSIQVAEKK